jgi:hypothetical protein
VTLPHCFSTSMGEKQYRLRKNVNKIGPSRSDFVEGGSVTLPYGGAVQLTDKSEFVIVLLRRVWYNGHIL